MGDTCYHQLNAYKRNFVETTTPLGLIIMLYDGAVSNLLRAERVIRSGDREEFGRTLAKAQDIVYELMGSLDFEKGGEIARNLYRIYEYMTYRLLQANLRGDAEIVCEVRDLLVQLKEAWEEADRKIRASRSMRTGSLG